MLHIHTSARQLFTVAACCLEVVNTVIVTGSMLPWRST